jgi:PAS domain-containing protein
LRALDGRVADEPFAQQDRPICSLLPGMHRFIEQQNISHLRRLLVTEAISDTSRHLLEEQLLAAQRRLAALTAVKSGLKSKPQIVRERTFPLVPSKLTGEFRDQFEAAAVPLLLIDPGPGLRIVHANHDYTTATTIDLGKVAGEKLFNVFPDNPGDPFADGVANLFDSFRIVAETGQPHAMAVQRYDVRGPSGIFEERYWQPLNSPVFNENGDLVFILNRAIEVTARFSRA